MDIAVMVLGFVAEVIAWSLVARGRNVWTTMTPVLATMGVVALVVGPIAWSPDVAPGLSLAVGLGLACSRTGPRASRWSCGRA
jgi:cell division protein FtsW (lipid II flippase)